MDPIAHLSQKILAERARLAPQQQRSPPPEVAPPPYVASNSGDDSDEEPDDDEPSSPLKLIINAAHSIQGSNNLVPTSPTPLADATKFSTILLHAINQINNAVDVSPAKPLRSIKVDLIINCGITVIGDRNVIGNVGLKQKSPANATAGPDALLESSTILGAKRKAEEDADEEPQHKRNAVGGPVA